MNRIRSTFSRLINRRDCLICNKKKVNYWFIFFIIFIFLGIFLRSYKIFETFNYSHDQDLASWFVRDVVENNHLRLIGQETSIQGVFIGPLYYYYQIPFYLIAKMDPIGAAYASIVIGIFGIVSAYWVFSKMYGSRAGFISSVLYSVSFFVINNDREAVPTMPVIIWSIWYIFVLEKLSNKKYSQAFLIASVLFGLIWNLNLALAIFAPFLLFWVFRSGWKLSSYKQLLIPGLIFIILMIPFAVFEFKYDFIQIRSILFSDRSDSYCGLEKVLRILYMSDRNISFFLFNNLIGIKFVGLVSFFTSWLVLYKNKAKSRRLLFGVMISWLWFVGVFMFYKMQTSEYYLNGLFGTYLFLFVVFLDWLFEKKLAIIAYFLLSIFVALNLQYYVSWNDNGYGYSEKKEVARIIKKDMDERGFDCVGISFITDPGNELGMRMFFYSYEIQTNKINDKIPVYTILFPLNKDGVKHDVSVGNMGLVYPDYDKYTSKEVEVECSDENHNLTQPMFGFTN